MTVRAVPLTPSGRESAWSCVDGIREATEDLRSEVFTRSQTADPGVVLFGSGIEQIRDGLERVEACTRRTVWNIQPHVSFDPDDRAHVLDARSRARGLELRMLVSERAASLHPLLPSMDPEARIAPVFMPMLIVDQSLVLLGGPESVSGDVTAWRLVAPSLIERSLAVWHACSRLSRPTLPLVPEPLNLRQLEIARALCRGTKDVAIARTLDVSLRTVERDVSRLLAYVGAGNRSEAIAFMLGGTQRRALRS